MSLALTICDQFHLRAFLASLSFPKASLTVKLQVLGVMNQGVLLRQLELDTT